MGCACPPFRPGLVATAPLRYKKPDSFSSLKPHFVLPPPHSLNITLSLPSSHLQPTSIIVWSFLSSLRFPAVIAERFSPLARLPAELEPSFCPCHPCNTLRHQYRSLTRAERAVLHAASSWLVNYFIFPASSFSFPLAQLPLHVEKFTRKTVNSIRRIARHTRAAPGEKGPLASETSQGEVTTFASGERENG